MDPVRAFQEISMKRGVIAFQLGRGPVRELFARKMVVSRGCVQSGTVPVRALALKSRVDRRVMLSQVGIGPVRLLLARLRLNNSDKSGQEGKVPWIRLFCKSREETGKLQSGGRGPLRSLRAASRYVNLVRCDQVGKAPVRRLSEIVIEDN